MGCTRTKPLREEEEAPPPSTDPPLIHRRRPVSSRILDIHNTESGNPTASCYRYFRSNESTELRAICEYEFVTEFMTWYTASKYGVSWYMGPDFIIRRSNDPRSIQTKRILVCHGPSPAYLFTVDDCSMYHKRLVKFTLDLIERTRGNKTMQPAYMFAICILAAQIIGRYWCTFYESYPFAAEIMQECIAMADDVIDGWERFNLEIHNV